MTEAETGEIPKGLSMSLDELIKQDRGKPGQQRQQNGSQMNRRGGRGQQRGRGRGLQGQGGRGGGRGRFNGFQQQRWQVRAGPDRAVALLVGVTPAFCTARKSLYHSALPLQGDLDVSRNPDLGLQQRDWRLRSILG